MVIRFILVFVVIFGILNWAMGELDLALVGGLLVAGGVTYLIEFSDNSAKE
jgi:hypothetical protein